MDKLTKYVKDYIYGLCESDIDNEVIGSYKDFILLNDSLFAQDISNELCFHSLGKSIFVFDEDNIPKSELKELCDFVNYKVKQDILKRINDIREIEECEQDDHAMANYDFLVGDL